MMVAAKTDHPFVAFTKTVRAIDSPLHKTEASQKTKILSN